MKKMIVMTALMVMAAGSAMAQATQGSVSYNCGTNTVNQININGVTFPLAKIEQEGYYITIYDSVLTLNHGKESTVIGTLEPRQACQYTAGLETSLINYNNANLVVHADVKKMSDCTAITTDGVYGFQESVDITFLNADTGSHMDLTQSFGNDVYSSMEACQADAEKL